MSKRFNDYEQFKWFYKTEKNAMSTFVIQTQKCLNANIRNIVSINFNNYYFLNMQIYFALIRHSTVKII